MKIWQAPLRSLYSLSFYKEVLGFSLSTGLAYLGFLSFLASIFAGIAFNARSTPEIREFTAWLKASAPKLEMTAEGLRMDAPSPYVMTHPRFGPIITIDLSKTSAEEKDFSTGGLLFLTKNRGFLHGARGIRAFDFKVEDKNFKPFPITGETYEKFAKILRGFLLGAVPLAVFLFFFIWKFTLALFYSLLARILNSFRREPLPYETLLNLCFFAMTAYVLIEFLTLFIPRFQIRGEFFTGLAVTGLYLGIAIIKTEPPLPVERY